MSPPDRAPSYLIRGARIVKPTRVLSGDLAVENGIVTVIGEPPPGFRPDETIEADGGLVLPGFIDIHCHGGMGLDLTEGVYDPARERFDPAPERYAEAFPALMRSLAENGTTTVLLATVAAPVERLKEALSALARYHRDPRNGRDGAFLLGAFIEGTFICRPEYAGAQNPAYFREPSPDLFEELDRAAEGAVRYVNVAPEWGGPALALIRELSARGVVAGAGHTQATADEYERAVREGLSVAVHFTNGPTGTSFKPFGGGGVLQQVLRSREVYAELICDGYHVNPSYVRDIVRRKRPERIVAVTDAMFPAGRDDIASFEVAGVRGRRGEDGKFLAVEGRPHTLFGSIIRMRDAFENILSWLTRRMPGIWRDEHLPMETDEALVWTARMCATNPARVLGMFDPPSQRLGQDLSPFRGGVQVGKRADLAVVRLAGAPGRYEVEVLHTFVAGRRVAGAGG